MDSQRFRRSRTALAVLSAASLVAAACGGSEPTESVAATTTTEAAVTTDAPATSAETTTQPPPTTAVAVEDTIPDGDGDQQAALSTAINSALLDWQADNGAPAVSISVRVPGFEPINIANGLADLTESETVTTESYFRIGSITKSMTATLILQLADEGLLDLDEPVQTYVPGWLDGYQYANEITIRQLMNHTNGLLEYAFDPGFYAVTADRLDTAYEPEELVEWLAGTEPLFAPGCLLYTSDAADE